MTKPPSGPAVVPGPALSSAARGVPLSAAPTSPSTPSIAFAVPAVAIPEGTGGTTTVSNTVNATRNGTTGALVVNLAYAGTATAGTDYAAGPTSVTIPDGQNFVAFDLTINGDATVELDETIIINAVLAAYPTATATKTITILNDDAAASNLSGGAARVAISDASYWTRTGGTLARTTETSYETALKNSSVNKTEPFPSATIPSGSIGYVSLKVGATDASSPPLFIAWQGNAAKPSAASPLVPTVWYSDNSTDGSPDTGTWTQDTAFACWRPNASSDADYAFRGQRYFFPTAAAGRWYQVRWDVTVANANEAVYPQVCCSSGEWLFYASMSIGHGTAGYGLTDMKALRTAARTATGGDTFVLTGARSGANQQAIYDEQLTALNTASFRRGIRAVFYDGWINDIAYAPGLRPYSSASQANLDAITTRAQANVALVRALNLAIVAPGNHFGNYKSTDYVAGAPYVNDDFQSPNGHFPFEQNIFRPFMKANMAESWDARFDLPWTVNYAAGANKFDSFYGTNDPIHYNGTGYTSARTILAPLFKLLYGQTPTQNTMEYLVAQLGSTTTTALKTRLQAVFDAIYAMYPTTSTTAQNNRATLRGQLDALATA